MILTGAFMPATSVSFHLRNPPGLRYARLGAQMDPNYWCKEVTYPMGKSGSTFALILSQNGKL